MSWSTRELAELAGTTVNTVRHYHQLGLLAEPERRSNGYKQYGVTHLLTLLRIRRLVDLGVPLARVSGMLERDELTEATLDDIDAELERGIERLTRAREQIATIRRERVAPDTPAGFERVASRLSVTDTEMVRVYSRFYSDDALADLAETIEMSDDELDDAVDALPEDADEATIDALATRYAPVIAQQYLTYPWLRDPRAGLRSGSAEDQMALAMSAATLYNAAQLEVFIRAIQLAHRLVDARSDEAEQRGGAEGGGGNE